MHETLPGPWATSETSGDSYQLSLFSKWGLPLKERTRSRQQHILHFKTVRYTWETLFPHLVISLACVQFWPRICLTAIANCP